MSPKSVFTALRIANVNVNGLCSKLNILSDFLLQEGIKLLCITESHLVSSISSSFVDIPHFNLIRHDVPGSVQKHGVCVFVHDSVSVDCVDQPLSNVLTFRLVSFNVHLVVVYRPPSNSQVGNSLLVSFISKYCLDKEVVLLGDFNLPCLTWSKPSTVQVPPLETSFIDAFSSLGLTQWVSESTFPRSGNILDLVLTSEQDRIGSINVLAPLPGCDHCPVVFDYVFQSEVSCVSDVLDSASDNVQQRAWHVGNYPAIRKHLSAVDWDHEFQDKSASECAIALTDVLTDLACKFVPIRKTQEQKPPWQTRPPSSMIRQRQLAWQKYKAVRQQLGRSASITLDAYTTFSNVNRQYRSFAVRAQADYEMKLIARAKQNPKLLHSHIRNKKVGRLSVGPLRLGSGQLSEDPVAMAECFAESFAAVYSHSSPDNPAPHQHHDKLIGDITITTSAVKAVLEGLDGNSAMGPDGIHPLLLKSCAPELAYPLCTIFRQSLCEGVVPEIWKESVVIPIFKKGSRNDPLNYRPVSLTSVSCKTMERLITQHLTGYLEDSALLDVNQFGFRAGRSTMDQLLLVYAEVSKFVDEGRTVDLILFDYSKAFDVVCHDILLAKLQHIGIQGAILDWISSFLSDRVMRVSAIGSKSQPRDVTSGVPQGSVLGPLLFLIYINHVAANLTCDYKIFADDLKIYACIPRQSSDPHQPSPSPNIQSDIDQLYTTSETWGLKMNPKKCAVLRFSRPYGDLTPAQYCMNGSEIPSVQSHSDLGVIVDTDLKFHSHIRSVAHKAGGLAQNFLKSTVCREPKFMLFLLTVHIRPIIEYCSCVWNTGYHGDLQLLESVQRRWTKQISSLKGLDYAARLRTLDLFSVQGRLLRADLIQYWKVFNGKSHISVHDLFERAPYAGTRGHCYKVFPPQPVTDVRRRAFNVRCVSAWNSLPQHVVTATSLPCFKKALTEALGDKLFEYVD